MTLYELFHPLVSYMVTCRHDAAAGRMPDKEVMLGHIMRELASIRKTGAASPDLAAELDDACTYTTFYIDYMVHEGNFPFARDWQDLGRTQYNELAGDEKFFDYMRRWLNEDSTSARDHLHLMHAMVASGFSGVLERRSVQLEELMRRVAEKINLPDEQKAKHALFDEGENTIRAVKPRKPALGAALAASACALILGLAVFYHLHTYREATDSLRKVLNETGEYVREEATLHAQNSDSMVGKNIELEKNPAQVPQAAPPAAAPEQPYNTPPDLPGDQSAQKEEVNE